MSLPVKTGLPDQLELQDSYILRFAAVDPTTGADVTGVVISNASVYGTTTGSTGGEGGPATGQWFLVPGPNA